MFQNYIEGKQTQSDWENYIEKHQANIWSLDVYFCLYLIHFWSAFSSSWWIITMLTDALVAVPDVWLFLRHVEPGLYVCQHDLPQGTFLPWSWQLWPGEFYQRFSSLVFILSQCFYTSLLRSYKSSTLSPLVFSDTIFASSFQISDGLDASGPGFQRIHSQPLCHSANQAVIPLLILIKPLD